MPRAATPTLPAAHSAEGRLAVFDLLLAASVDRLPTDADGRAIAAVVDGLVTAHFAARARQQAAL